jgi:hypothetical protein
MSVQTCFTERTRWAHAEKVHIRSPRDGGDRVNLVDVDATTSRRSLFWRNVWSVVVASVLVFGTIGAVWLFFFVFFGQNG